MDNLLDRREVAASIMSLCVNLSGGAASIRLVAPRKRDDNYHLTTPEHSNYTCPDNSTLTVGVVRGDKERQE